MRQANHWAGSGGPPSDAEEASLKKGGYGTSLGQTRWPILIGRSVRDFPESGAGTQRRPRRTKWSAGHSLRSAPHLLHSREPGLLHGALGQSGEPRQLARGEYLVGGEQAEQLAIGRPKGSLCGCISATREAEGG